MAAIDFDMTSEEFEIWQSSEATMLSEFRDFSLNQMNLYIFVYPGTSISGSAVIVTADSLKDAKELLAEEYKSQVVHYQEPIEDYLILEHQSKSNAPMAKIIGGDW